MRMTHGHAFGVQESSLQNKLMNALLDRIRHQPHFSGFGSLIAKGM
jgi:hypothetical protein